MTRAVLVMVAISAAQGCQTRPAPVQSIPEKAATDARPGTATELDSPAIGDTKERTATDEEGAATAEGIFDVLTAHRWTGRQPGQPAFPPLDYSVASFRADGTWSFEFFTDYHIPAKTGKWNLQLVQGQWFLCQDDGGRGRVAVNDGTITLVSGKLYPHEPLARDPRHTAATLPELKLLPEVQEIARRLTAHTWKRTNDLDLFMEPTRVHFRPDWTYIATYRSGECKSEGTWYAKAEEIVATSPAGQCDRPESGGGDALTAKVIDDRRILVNWDLYVPEDEPLPRGILWALFGYSDVASIRIEYDMPIRQGVPTAFDVTITNASREPLSLERFSFTRGYSNYGRDVGDRGKQLVLPDDETAGHDLKGAVLQAGQSHSFRLSATFSEVGRPVVYFNALISGTSQNWDTHQAHWPSVSE